MKAIETTATINNQGQLSLDFPLEVRSNRRVRVIVLIAEADDPDPEDTPDDVVLEGLREGLQEALAGTTIPLSQMWDGIDAE
ncbi:MAG: hypothetical protein VKI82_04915 [Leptolyngbya sp.]|nr:hypothetical protein [Leptolyngbya sp.]